MHGCWRYARERCWLVRRLAAADDSAWCDDGWCPTFWQLRAARLLDTIETWRAAWLCVCPPLVADGFCVADLSHDCHPWWERAWLRCKAATCLILGLSPTEHYPLHSIEVVWFDSDTYETADGTGSSWEAVHVGEGFFRNWWAYMEHDSNP